MPPSPSPPPSAPRLPAPLPRGQPPRGERSLRAGRDGGRRGGDPDRHYRQRRPPAPGSPGPEARQVQATGAVVPGDQQIGDQEAAEHEEDVDAEEAAGQPGSP